MTTLASRSMRDSCTVRPGGGRGRERLPGQLGALCPDDLPRLSSGRGDPRQLHSIEAFEQAPHGRVRRDRIEQAKLIHQRRDVTDAFRAIGDRDREVGQNLKRIMPDPATSQPTQPAREPAVQIWLWTPLRVIPRWPGSLVRRSRPELAGRKLIALFDCAAARDFVDVFARSRRFSEAELLALACEVDAGFEVGVSRRDDGAVFALQRRRSRPRPRRRERCRGPAAVLGLERRARTWLPVMLDAACHPTREAPARWKAATTGGTAGGLNRVMRSAAADPSFRGGDVQRSCNTTAESNHRNQHDQQAEVS